MDTAGTIPTGAMAERWKLSAFCRRSGSSCRWCVYPIFGNWVWGGGWLATLGIELRPRPRPRGLRRLVGRAHGRRRGRAGRRRSSSGRASASTPRRRSARRCPATTCRWPSPAPSSWRSAGSGSTRARRLAGTDLRIGVDRDQHDARRDRRRADRRWSIVWLRFGKPDPGMMVNGMLAGLVAITAPCAFVTSASAVLIGVVAGVAGRRGGALHREARSRSTIRSAPSRCTASTAPGASCRSACSPTAPTATAGTACPAPSRGCSTAIRASSSRSASAR